MTIVQCSVGREVDVYVVIGHGRELATKLGFNHIDRTRIEIVILELARNILAHANRGEIVLEVIEQDDRKGLVVEARDRGPGIENIDLALRDGYSTKRTLGAGLPGVKRMMDDFAISSTPGVGTVVRGVKWLGQHSMNASRSEGRLS